jgi:hypothetical protein
MDLKKVIKRFFPQLVQLRNRMYNDRAHSRFKNKPLKEVFSQIYNENHWQSTESRSGTGSDEEQTKEVRQLLEQVVKERGITSMTDIPCGDFNWMEKVTLPANFQYYGFDIVDDLITTNSRKFGTSGKVFQWADITSSQLPKVDLIFCRDCLVHLSYDAIDKAIKNVKSSGSKYLLTTSFTAHENRDIVSGNWRPINLESEPFRFPKPLAIYNEHCTEDEKYRDKSLALWKIQDL